MMHANKYSFLYLTLALMLCCTAAKAQLDVHFNQHWALQGYYHPGWVGNTSKLNVTGSLAMQLMGFTHAPKTTYFGADMPVSFLNRKHGVGLGFMSESIGLFRNQRTWAQYAYKKHLGKTLLGVGLQVGAINIGFDPEHLNLGEEPDDEAFPKTAESGTSMDLGLGAYYRHPKFYVGVSGQHLNSPSIELGENTRMTVSPMLYLTAGYNIQTRNPLVSIQPSLHLQSDFVSTRLDLTTRLHYTYRERVLNAGLTYSPNTSVAVHVGATIKGITLGYVYEFYTSRIGVASGSHDLLVSYSTEINWFKRNKNKHKSIRIL